MYEPSEEIQFVSRQSRTYFLSFPSRTGSQTGIISSILSRPPVAPERGWYPASPPASRPRRRPRARTGSCGATVSRSRERPRDTRSRSAERASRRSARAPGKRFASGTVAPPRRPERGASCGTRSAAAKGPLSRPGPRLRCGGNAASSRPLRRARRGGSRRPAPARAGLPPAGARAQPLRALDAPPRASGRGRRSKSRRRTTRRRRAAQKRSPARGPPDPATGRGGSLPTRSRCRPSTPGSRGWRAARRSRIPRRGREGRALPAAEPLRAIARSPAARRRTTSGGPRPQTWRRTRPGSRDPVPVHEPCGGGEKHSSREDPPDEPGPRSSARSFGEREIHGIDDHQEPRHPSGKPGRHRQGDRPAGPCGVRPPLLHELVDADGREHERGAVVEDEGRVALPVRVDETDLHGKDPRRDPRKGARAAVPSLHGTKEQRGLAINPSDPEDPEKDGRGGHEPGDERPDPWPASVGRPLFERREKERRRHGERRRARQPEQKSPQGRLRGLRAPGVPEGEEREQKKHRLGIDGREKERCGKQKEERHGRGGVPISEPLHALAVEKAHREKEA